MKLSIIIPVYNEEQTITQLLDKVDAVALPFVDGKRIEKEMVVVDDGSKDRSRELILDYAKKKQNLKYFFHQKNLGKADAIKTGLKSSTGEIMLLQDADLEYEPNDYPALLAPILTGEAKVVYGSRFFPSKGHFSRHKRFTYWLHVVGNYGLTVITNILYGSKLTDMETCYKVFTREALNKILPLTAKRFDLEPELTAKFLKHSFKIREVRIKYYSRDFSEGKKITWRDGIKALYYLVKERF
jgi:dolichol-phosphate mannosyltransferase